MRSVQWMITGRCNLRCRHCYLGGLEGAGLASEPSLDRLLRIMDQMWEAGIREVVLTGGEPLIRRDIRQVFEALTRREIRVSRVMTNGLLLTEDFLSFLEDLGQRPVFNISYDGAGGAHDALRGSRGAGAAVLQAFSLCRRRGFATASDMTVDAESAQYLRQSVRALADHGCGLIKAVPFLPLGNGAKEDARLRITGEQFLDLVCAYIPEYYGDGIASTLYLGSLFYGEGSDGGWTIPALAPESSRDPAAMSLCSRDSMLPFLSGTGRLMPCAGMIGLEKFTGPFVSVEEAGFEAARRGDAFRKAVAYTVADQRRRNPECGACPFALSCGGGCRVTAMAWEGDFSGRDPFVCAFFRHNGRQRIREAVSAGLLTRIRQHVQIDGQP